MYKRARRAERRASRGQIPAGFSRLTSGQLQGKHRGKRVDKPAKTTFWPARVIIYGSWKIWPKQNWGSFVSSYQMNIFVNLLWHEKVNEVFRRADGGKIHTVAVFVQNFSVVICLACRTFNYKQNKVISYKICKSLITFMGSLSVFWGSSHLINLVSSFMKWKCN